MLTIVFCHAPNTILCFYLRPSLRDIMYIFFRSFYCVPLLFSPNLSQCANFFSPYLCRKCMCMCKCSVLFAVWCPTKSSFVLISAKFSIYFHYESFCVLKHFFRLFVNMQRDNFSSEHLFHFCGKIDTFIA